MEALKLILEYIALISFFSLLVFAVEKKVTERYLNKKKCGGEHAYNKKSD